MKIQQKIKNQIFWKMDDDKNVNKYLGLRGTFKQRRTLCDRGHPQRLRSSLKLLWEQLKSPLTNRTR